MSAQLWTKKSHTHTHTHKQSHTQTQNIIHMSSGAKLKVNLLEPINTHFSTHLFPIPYKQQVAEILETQQQSRGLHAL